MTYVYRICSATRIDGNTVYYGSVWRESTPQIPGAFIAETAECWDLGGAIGRTRMLLADLGIVAKAIR